MTMMMMTTRSASKKQEAGELRVRIMIGGKLGALLIINSFVKNLWSVFTPPPESSIECRRT
jgi:hypothetical protein